MSDEFRQRFPAKRYPRVGVIVSSGNLDVDTALPENVRALLREG